MAVLASLFLIAMTPALVYNRMIFLENGASFFFLATFLCLLRYTKTDDRRYVVASTLFAGLSILCKINGLVSLAFLVVYLAQKRKVVKNAKYLILTVAIALIFPLVLSITYGINPLEIVTKFFKQYQVFRVKHEFSVWTYLILNTLPSGQINSYGGYFQLEYWYLFSYFSLVYIASKDYEKISDVVLVFLTFIGFFLAVGGIGSYYIILIQPFFAIVAGYAITKIFEMTKIQTLMVYFFFYIPTIISLITFLNNTFGLNSIIYQTKMVLIVIPLALMGASALTSNETLAERLDRWNSRLLVITFFAVLLAGSYLLPVFYSHYFT